MSTNSNTFLKITIIMGIAAMLCLISTNKYLEKSRLVEARNKFREYYFKYNRENDFPVINLLNNEDKLIITQNNLFKENYTQKDSSSTKPIDKVTSKSKAFTKSQSVAIETTPITSYKKLVKSDYYKSSKDSRLSAKRKSFKVYTGVAKELPLISRKNVEPKINLNKKKFLFPLLSNGPNNQLMGLRESIYIAIRLNRTLVLPFFRKHRTDT